MSDDLGRSDFLDAATVLRKGRAVLEARRKEIDGELTIYKNAEEALLVLGEADRVRGEVEARISKARSDLADLSAKVLAAEKKSQAAIAGFDAQVKAAQEKTEELLAAEESRQRITSARIKALEDSVAEREVVAGDRLADFDTQIAERESALNALRATIANLAKM